MTGCLSHLKCFDSCVCRKMRKCQMLSCPFNVALIGFWLAQIENRVAANPQHCIFFFFFWQGEHQSDVFANV